MVLYRSFLQIKLLYYYSSNLKAHPHPICCVIYQCYEQKPSCNLNGQKISRVFSVASSLGSKPNQTQSAEHFVHCPKGNPFSALQYNMKCIGEHMILYILYMQYHVFHGISCYIAEIWITFRTVHILGFTITKLLATVYKWFYMTEQREEGTTLDQLTTSEYCTLYSVHITYISR